MKSTTATNFFNLSRLLKEAETAAAQAETKSAAAVAEAAPAIEPITTDLRLHEQFHSRFLPAERNLVVYLPPGYAENPQHRYPVLYLHDGQNLFDGKTAYIPGKDWKADETAEDLINSGAIQPLIMVGIYNTGEQRIQEYTPWPDPKLGGGHADLYGRMLVEELIPFINQRYRTLPGPGETGLGGSSLGGLVTLYLGLRYPEVFGKLAVLSPSIWWDNKYMLDFVDRIGLKPRLKIWLDVGTAEGEDTLKNAEQVRDELLKCGWVEGDDLRYAEFKGARHEETAWGARVAPILKFLFPAHGTAADL
jgi:predicted alpha/beta superfamily hydrolase